MIKEGNIDNFTQLKFLNKYLVETKGYIAGGCFKNILSGEKPKDIDVFFRNIDDFIEAKKLFSSNDKEFSLHYANDNVTAFKDNSNGIIIELVSKEFANPVEMIETFDFTITKFVMYREFDEALDKAVNKIFYHEYYFEHLFMKRLVLDDIENISYPLGVFNRMLRYCSYGYIPCKETKLKMVEIIRENQGEINTGGLYEGKD